MTYLKFYNPYLNAYRDEQTSTRVPAANVFEADKEYRIEMALPGVDKNDIQINHEKGFLKVSVEKKEDNQNGYDRHEFDYHGAERVFKTGDKVDSDNISAKYENGVLILTLPKKEAYVKKPARSIEIG